MGDNVHHHTMTIFSHNFLYFLSPVIPMHVYALPNEQPKTEHQSTGAVCTYKASLFHGLHYASRVFGAVVCTPHDPEAAGADGLVQHVILVLQRPIARFGGVGVNLGPNRCPSVSI